MNSWNYAKKPLNIYWEVTRACDLACRHCRAEAIKKLHPLELTTEEGKRVLDEICSFGDPPPRLILTGGDPLKRPDLFELIEYGTSLGISISITPSGTENLTMGVLRKLKRHGIQSIALSLDGSSPDQHDTIRGVLGCFNRTLKAASYAREFGLTLQINTLVTNETLSDLPGIFEVVKNLGNNPAPCRGGVNRWSLFFLIPVGRGLSLKEITPEECEELFHWIYSLNEEAPFAIATTEAPHFRRLAFSKMRSEGHSLESIRQSPIGRGFGIRDGNGILFISHIGQVYPAGFLPLLAGNIKVGAYHNTPLLVEIYRNSEIFRNLRDPRRFKGKCGQCEFKMICGGSRARAYARTGDFLESDPLCSYQPKR